jgi:hypothetical protein
MKRKLHILMLTLSLLSGILTVHESDAQQIIRTPGDYIYPVDESSLPVSASGSAEPWLVFSDRSGNAMYTDEYCRVIITRDVAFMRAFYVIGESIDKESLRVVTDDFVSHDGTLMPGFEDHSGWMRKSALLLSRRCLKTRNSGIPGQQFGLFDKKALMWNMIPSNPQAEHIPSFFYSEPGCTRVIDTALFFQINFIYKETEDACLVSAEEMINPDDISKVKGWVKKDNMIEWNNNFAFEANWDREAVDERNSGGIRAKIFSDPENAKMYYTDCQVARGVPAVYDEKQAASYRPMGGIIRFPVLKQPGSGVFEVGITGNILGTNSEHKPKEQQFDYLKRILDSVSANMRKVNIVFVIDGNKNIAGYRDNLADAIKESNASINKKLKKDIRFGAVIYRDAADERRALQAFPELVGSERLEKLTKWITYNLSSARGKCDEDRHQAMFYGIKFAVNHYALKPFQSNFLILVGGAGNDNRSTYMGQDSLGNCGAVRKEDFTDVPLEDIASLLGKYDVNMVSYQVVHGKDKAYEDFVHQLKEIYCKTAEIRWSTACDSNTIKEVKPSLFMLDSGPGGVYSLRCPVNTGRKANKYPLNGSIGKEDFADSIVSSLESIDHYVDEMLAELFYPNREDSGGDLAGSVPRFKPGPKLISLLRSLGFTDEEMETLFGARVQEYLMGYTYQTVPYLHYPLFLNVLLLSYDDLYSMNYALEELIPKKDNCRSPSDFRYYIRDTWYSILAEDLHCLPQDLEIVDNLSLYDLSLLLCGTGIGEEYRDISLKDVINPEKFSDEDLYLYLTGWMIAKGHVQSILEGQNMLTEDFFREHVSCYFIEYLIAYAERIGGDSSKILDSPDLETEIVKRLSELYHSFNSVYRNPPKFRIPEGDPLGAATTYYWIDTRIFPHKELYNRQIDAYKQVLEEFREKYSE